MVLVGATFAVLTGTLIAALLLFGRFVFLAFGFFLAGTALITLQKAALTGPQGVAVLVLALALIIAGRPRFARRKRVVVAEEG